MKNRKTGGVCIFLLSMLLAVPAAVLADFNSGSTGADGAFAPPSSPNTYVVPANSSGVYNFTTVTIPSGVTVTFQKNANNSPITVLASGDVMINGTISVNGGDGSNYQPAGTGGPGGFDGGIGGWLYSNGYRGFGPGGGDGSTASNGSNNATGGNGGTFTYGNDGQIPMIGGSGGSGGGGGNIYTGGAGGGGGGAILIASSGTITVNGAVTANGGNGASCGGYSGWWFTGGGGGGSGGAVRLIATTIAGNGTISANGGAYGSANGNGYGTNGGGGRIRLEAWNFTRTATTSPVNTLKWYPTAIAPTTLPTLAITSVGGVPVPNIPKGDSKSPDIQLPANITNPVAVTVSSTNIPSGTTITVKSLSGVGTTVQTASTTLSGANGPLTGTVNINLAVGYPTVLTVSATYTAVASNGSPLYAEGERVDKIRVDTAMGGSQTVTYITASGREIPQKYS